MKKHRLHQRTGKINQRLQYLTLTVTLKYTATKKMKLRVTGYSQGEYYYVLSKRGLLIQYKNYSISNDKNIPAYACLV